MENSFEKLNFKLEVFEGPLDLLLHLIEKNKVNIYDIPIAEITDQYMAYLDEMKRRDLDIMSEFLVMASTLLSIKAKMLLPKQETADEEESEDPRQELVDKLIEYKMVKEVSKELREMETDADQIFYKAPTIPDEVKQYEEPVDIDALLDGLTLKKLNEIFQQVLQRQKNRVDPIRSGFREIRKEEVTVEEKQAYITSYLLNHHTFSFRNLLTKQSSKTEVIVTFLAILEMMKAGEIHTTQDGTFADIIIESRLAA
jgi:segregation and condensation protein A